MAGKSHKRLCRTANYLSNTSNCAKIDETKTEVDKARQISPVWEKGVDVCGRSGCNRGWNVVHVLDQKQKSTSPTPHAAAHAQEEGRADADLE